MQSNSHSNKLSIRDLPDGERPRERLLAHGAKALSNAELVAVILRTGTAQENVLHLAERILAECNGLVGLAQVSQGELERIPGLGPTKITQILATVEVAQRLMAHPGNTQPIINSAEDAARLVMDMRHLTQEHVRVILLDGAKRVISIQTVYIGTLNTTVLRVSEIFREAVTRNCAALILVHNHPTGDAFPSPEDIEITRTLIAAGNLLDIQLFDHLIVGQQDWVSLKQMKLAFS